MLFRRFPVPFDRFCGIFTDLICTFGIDLTQADLCRNMLLFGSLTIETDSLLDIGPGAVFPLLIG